MEFMTYMFENSTDITVLLGILIISLYILLRHVIVSRADGIPPGPTFRLPVVGNLYAVEPDMRKFLRSYRKMYGDIYSLYFGNKLVIVIAGYERIKEAFVKNADVFSNRPKGDIIKKLSKGLGIGNTDGELWKEHRRFAINTLRQFGLGKSIMENQIQVEVKSLLNAFHSMENNPFDPKQILLVSVSNVIHRISFGKTFKHDDTRFSEMPRRLEENLSRAGHSAILTFIPALEMLPGDLFKIKRTIKSVNEVYGFLRELAQEHLQNYDENNIEDFTSAFIKEMKEQESEKGGTTFTIDQLVVTLGDFFTAGSETTSTTLRWALVYLVNHPDIQEQIYKDIVDVVGTDRLPALQDREKLPLVEAFYQECLRHANLTITSLGHATSEDVTFVGYKVPTDAIILADMDSVNNDRRTWGDPQKFRPERFIAEDGSLLKIEEFIPFFLGPGTKSHVLAQTIAGRRICLGMSTAKMELFLFLSAIVQCFNISAPPGHDLSLESVDGVFGLVHCPKPYRVVATVRGSLPF